MSQWFLALQQVKHQTVLTSAHVYPRSGVFTSLVLRVNAPHHRPSVSFIPVSLQYLNNPFLITLPISVIACNFFPTANIFLLAD